MELLIDFAKNVFYNCCLENDDVETKYNILMQKYSDFTKTYPLVVKYMCLLTAFDVELFREMLNAQQKSRCTYEDSFKFQVNYIKQLMVKCGISKIEAKKISNQEYDDILIQIKKIKKSEAKIKKNTQKLKIENFNEIRKETLDFVTNI